MNDRVRAANSGSREPSPATRSRPVGFDPGRSELSRMVAELLDPLRGIERGLLPEDGPAMLLNIRVSELRKIGTCLRLTHKTLLGEDEQ